MTYKVYEAKEVAGHVERQLVTETKDYVEASAVLIRLNAHGHYAYLRTEV